jgi:hypothetical protein
MNYRHACGQCSGPTDSGGKSLIETWRAEFAEKVFLQEAAHKGIASDEQARRSLTPTLDDMAELAVAAADALLRRLG